MRAGTYPGPLFQLKPNHMPTIKLTGFLTDVFPVETFPNFAKKVFWLKEPDTERYPNHWELELHQNEVTRINEFQIGDRLECEVEIRGRQFTNRRQEKSIDVSLKCVGIQLLNRIDTTKPSALGRFTGKKSVPQDGEKKIDPQGELPL
jgi:hypothetical protein